jgi:hypothetical protein
VLPRIPGYDVLAELGRGGMGVVYKARQVGFNRLVALKMLLSGAHAGDEERERFLREAESVARLKHPGIVDVYAFGELDGCPYFSLEYLEGGSLAERLGGRPLAPREAAVLAAELARAVHYAHREGIVHRDLKPANVLLTADGRPKITDFGLAKRLDVEGRTQTGAVMGTPGYMAPEQAEGKGRAIGPHTDVYALGAVLYEMLTGRPPFRAATTLDTLLLVLSAQPMPPRDVNPHVPADLETICLKCLAKDPEQRYASARRLAEDLDCFLKGEAPVHAKPTRGWRHWNQLAWRNTNLPLWALIACAVVVLVLTPFGGVYFPMLPIAAAATAAFLLTRPRAASLAVSGATLVAALIVIVLYFALGNGGPDAAWIAPVLAAPFAVAVIPLVGLLFSRADRYLCLSLLAAAGLAAVGWILAGNPVALALGLLIGLMLGAVSRVTARIAQTPAGVPLAGASLGLLLNPCGCGPFGPLAWLIGLSSYYHAGPGGGVEESWLSLIGFGLIYVPLYLVVVVAGAVINVWIYRSRRRRLWERSGYVATVRQAGDGTAAGPTESLPR